MDFGDFGALPPEINSASMYSGPGAAPMLAAASAWDGVASDLSSTASSFSSVISGLTSQWLGPASTAMAAAAAPHNAWLSTAAAQAEQVANQARAAVAAYEAAFAMTVPPPVIEANRSLLMSLVATNFLGQNTPAIAATEAHYADMWAQDAGAMYGYAGDASAASTLTPFDQPKQVSSPAGAMSQAAGVGGADTQAALSQFTTAMPQALQSLATPGVAGAAETATDSSAGLGSMGGLTSMMMPLRMATMPMMMLMRMMMMGAMGANGAKAAGAATPALAAGTAAGAESAAGAAVGTDGLGSLGSLTLTSNVSAPAAPAVSAGLGRAVSLGSLSVPQTWSAAAPTAALTSAATPVAHGTGAGMMPPLMPMTAGRGIGGAAGTAATAPQLETRPTVMLRSPLGG